MLLNSGAEIDLRCMEDKATALMIACQRGNREVVELLVKRGADVNARTVLDGYGYSPLVLTAEFGFIDVVKTLVEAGAEVNARNGEAGHTAIMVSAQNEHVETVRYLLEKGADATMQTKDGASTLSFGQTGSGTEEEKAIVKMLKNASATRRKFKIT
jgi:ankyrin repeat protein